MALFVLPLVEIQFVSRGVFFCLAISWLSGVLFLLVLSSIHTVVFRRILVSYKNYSKKFFKKSPKRKESPIQ